MSEGIPYADIVILALVAGFILLRLRSVLGDRSGNEPDYFSRLKPAQPPAPVVQVDEKSLKAKPKEEADTYLAGLGESDIAATLNKIKEKDPLFSATNFMRGARSAFEMVFDAFVKGDRQTLKMLLADPIYQEFGRELDQRDAQENKTETTLVSVTAREISQATFEKNTARLTVHFSSEQVTVTRNGKGEIIEGNPSDLHHVEDHWTFERDVTSKNPNWKIIET